jgi:hypothetical protein
MLVLRIGMVTVLPVHGLDTVSQTKRHAISFADTLRPPWDALIYTGVTFLNSQLFPPAAGRTSITQSGE